MSGIVKGIKKVFQTVVHVVKKIWKPLLIAAAIYFTAGVALSAFPATAAFASSMPLFAGGGVAGLGIGAGAAAGTGIFTHLAVALGVGSLGAAGGLTGAAAIPAGAATAVAAQGANAALINSGVSSGLTAAAGGAAPALATSVAAKGAMSLGEKFLIASTVSSTLGGLTAPSPKEIAEAQKRWSGAFYGVNADGSGGAAAVPDGLIPTPSTKPGAPADASADTGGRPLGSSGPSSAPRITAPPDTQAARSALANGGARGPAYQYGHEQPLIPESEFNPLADDKQKLV